jgi:hypothetical protein
MVKIYNEILKVSMTEIKNADYHLYEVVYTVYLIEIRYFLHNLRVVVAVIAWINRSLDGVTRSGW